MNLIDRFLFMETISKWPQKGTSIDGVTNTQWASHPLESRKSLCLAETATKGVSESNMPKPSWVFKCVFCTFWQTIGGII